MRVLLFFCALTSAVSALGQVARPADGGGGFTPTPAECVSSALRATSDSVVAANRQWLRSQGLLPTWPAPSLLPTTTLGWPVRQATGFGYRDIYAISNYVDHNPAFPNSVQDWNCGARTYDTNAGYNHAGMDIFLWPFDQNMMAAGQVEIVAAAPGVIVAKFDNNFDRNCAFNSSNWNAVYIQHADGTVAWYGHMKRSSLTSKAIGASVVQGEFLGLVGSSGNSTGPHLHFELHDAVGTVVDPYTGACSTGQSWWAAQKPYYESGLNAVLTHQAPPVFNTCPAPHSINNQDAFQPGDSFYCAAYFRDQLNGQLAQYAVYRPDGSVFASWSHASSVTHYTASYWWWQHTLPTNAPTGTWELRVTYEGATVSHTFTVGVVAGLSQNAAPARFTLTPNPASRTVSVTLPELAGSADLEVRDGLGRLVRRVPVTSSATTLDLTGWPAGLYHVAVPGAGSRRLVVE